jgi:hypothetical protein
MNIIFQWNDELAAETMRTGQQQFDGAPARKCGRWILENEKTFNRQHEQHFVADNSQEAGLAEQGGMHRLKLVAAGISPLLNCQSDRPIECALIRAWRGRISSNFMIIA